MAKKNIQDQRRNQIIEGLHRCLKDKPYSMTSIKDIAREAGVNHGVLHYYFKNKEDILVHYIDAIILNYHSRFLEWAADQGNEILSSDNFRIKSMEIMHIFLEMNTERNLFEVWSLAAYYPGIKKKLQDAYHIWIKAAEEFFKRNGLPPKETQRIAKALIAFYEGVSLMERIMPRKEYNPEDLMSWFISRIQSMRDTAPHSDGI